MSSAYGSDYETVAASQTAQVMGPSVGRIGDLLKLLVVVPATLDAGSIAIKDGSDAAITVFTGGTGSVASLRPMVIVIDARSRTGSWQVTTGANVSVVAVGSFT